MWACVSYHAGYSPEVIQPRTVIALNRRDKDTQNNNIWTKYLSSILLKIKRRLLFRLQ